MENTRKPAIQIAEKKFGDLVLRATPLATIEARKLQLRIASTLGGPFLSAIDNVIGDGQDDDDVISMAGFSDALLRVDAEKSVELIKDLCELTMNTTHNRPTNYNLDFTADGTLDIEVAMWMVETHFSNFISALKASPLLTQVTAAMGLAVNDTENSSA